MNQVAFEAARQADLDRWEVTLPRPLGRSDLATENLDFEPERFFVHPSVLTVGTTSDRGFEEHEYIPQLQTFKMKHEGQVVGTLVLMTDHVLGSFHHAGQQYDLAQIGGSAYAVMDFNRRTNLAPFECGVIDEELGRAAEEAQSKISVQWVVVAASKLPLTWTTTRI